MRSASVRAARLCASLVVAAAPLAAQQAHQPRDTTAARGMAPPMRGMPHMMGMPQMMGMMACPMISAMMRGPTAALRARDTLHLSTSQASRLDALQRQVGETHTRVMDSMRVLQPRIAALASASQFDEPAVRKAFTQMGGLHADMAVALLRAQHETDRILTPGQRDALAAMARAHQGMEGMPASGQRRAGPDACRMMESGSPGPQGPAAKRDSLDSLHNHQHGADTSGGRQ